jgi:hypothetical protein
VVRRARRAEVTARELDVRERRCGVQLLHERELSAGRASALASESSASGSLAIDLLQAAERQPGFGASGMLLHGGLEQRARAARIAEPRITFGQ